MVRKSEPLFCHSFHEFYLHTSFRLSESALPYSGWLGRVAGLIGIDHFPFVALEGSSIRVDSSFMGIVYRLINTRSDNKFIHRRSIARRFCLTLAKLPSRYFARFCNDAFFHRSVDISWRISRTTLRGSGWTFCRHLTRRLGHL